MSAMDKAQTNAAWRLAKNCMKSYPVAYKRILTERNALKSELEVADAETQNLRNHAYVLTGNKPFSGQEVLDLLNENDELRKAATLLYVNLKVVESENNAARLEDAGLWSVNGLLQRKIEDSLLAYLNTIRFRSNQS